MSISSDNKPDNVKTPEERVNEALWLTWEFGDVFRSFLDRGWLSLERSTLMEMKDIAKSHLDEIEGEHSKEARAALNKQLGTDANYEGMAGMLIWVLELIEETVVKITPLERRKEEPNANLLRTLYSWGI